MGITYNRYRSFQIHYAVTVYSTNQNPDIKENILCHEVNFAISFYLFGKMSETYLNFLFPLAGLTLRHYFSLELKLG